MSKKLKLNRINFDDSDFIVEIEDKKKPVQKVQKSIVEDEKDKLKIESELILNRAKDEAQNIIQKTQEEMEEFKQKTIQEVNDKKEEILSQANTEAQNIINSTKEASLKEKEELINSSKEKIEKERIEKTKQGYDEGYRDGLDKIQEELEEKIKTVENFSKVQFEIKDRIIKSACRDILDLIVNISRKVLLKEADGISIDKILKKTIGLLEKKENVSIILSEKYARALYEIQKKSLNQEIELNFENFDRYEGFNIIYNPKFDDDTIIVENLKERLDASINSQIDIIIRDILENSKNGQIELGEYYKEDEA